MAGNIIMDEQNTPVDILGSTWNILFADKDEVEAFRNGTCWGYAEDNERIICLCKPYEDEDSLGLGIKAQRINLRRVLRHELIHAFLSESGLADSSKGTGEDGWATNEEMVDWFARMSPKIFNTYKELGIC